MYFSHAITSEINKQVDKEIPILTNALKEPYLLNSCCIQKDIDPIINYFIEKNKLIKETSDKIYQDLSKMGYEILLDDRDLGYGSKIKDSELLGIPLNIVIGNKFVKEDLVEIQTRQGDSSLTKLDDLNEILDHYKNY